MTKRISTRKALKSFIGRNKGWLDDQFEAFCNGQVARDPYRNVLCPYHIQFAAQCFVANLSKLTGINSKIIWTYFHSKGRAICGKDFDDYYTAKDVVSSVFCKEGIYLH